MIVCPDETLNRLILHHITLQRKLAHVLNRVGASHPERAKENAKRAVKRKALRRELRQNAHAIAARTIELFTP